jgi:AraC-like DNA-binding protein
MTRSEAAPIHVADSNPPPPASEPGRQGFMRQNMELDFLNRSPVGRQFSVTARNLGSVRVGRVLGTPSSFFRTRRHIADNRDMISVVVSGGGRFQVEGVHGESRYACNGAAVLESRRESALHSLDDSAAWTIVMDRAPLEPLLAGVRGPLQRCIQGDNPALRLLDGYLKTMFALDRDIDGALANVHIRDLALSALGVTGDAQAVVRERGVRGARLQVALARLADDAAEPGLDPATFAGRLGVSVRYLHRLLEPTGRSFSEHLLACRLARAVAMLREPDCGLRIADIAREAGFSGISHFNRSFRRAFGDTPYGLRVRATRHR